jgi:uncharacterized membrane-anchored protein YhcB (DUF1043 family)
MNKSRIAGEIFALGLVVGLVIGAAIMGMWQ